MLQEFIISWNNAWRYDFWWRQKYKIPFGSEQHLRASQIDIAIEYFEDRLANKAYEQVRDDQARLKYYKETGQWMMIDENKQKEKFDAIDISKLN